MTNLQEIARLVREELLTLIQPVQLLSVNPSKGTGDVSGRFRSNGVLFDYTIGGGTVRYRPVGAGGGDRSDAADQEVWAGPRLDAARGKPRNCTTGYPCGSTCIQKGKNCKAKGGAAAQKLAAMVRAGTQDDPASKSSATADRGGALARQPRNSSGKQEAAGGNATLEEKYAGRLDNKSIREYAKEKAQQLLSDPKAWAASKQVELALQDRYFNASTLKASDEEALKAFNGYYSGQLKTRAAELKRGHSFFTDKPEDIEKRLEKAKRSKAKNRDKTVAKLTKQLADARQALEDARKYVEETHPRLMAMSPQEKVAHARKRARAAVDREVEYQISSFKSAARGGKELEAVADFLRVEMGGRRKAAAQMAGESSDSDEDVIRDRLSGQGTGEATLGLPVGAKPTVAELKAAYRKAAARTHPDAGGSAEEFAVVQRAYERLKKEYKYDSADLSISDLLQELEISRRALRNRWSAARRDGYREVLERSA